MQERATWRELYRSDDATHVRGIATTIAAMHFEVRCRHQDGLWRGLSDEESPGHPPYVIEVPEPDWPMLHERIDDIISEQMAFDRRLDDPARGARRARQRFTLLVIVIVIVLAAFGLIDL